MTKTGEPTDNRNWRERLRTDEPADKRSWRERLGVGTREMPRLSDEYGAQHSEPNHLKASKEPWNPQPEPTPDSRSLDQQGDKQSITGVAGSLPETSANNPLVLKLRDQRRAAEHLAEARVLAARERIENRSPAVEVVAPTPSKMTAPQVIRTQEKTDDDRSGGAGGRSVFLIHGRNAEINSAMNMFLRSINLRPIEFSKAIHNAISEGGKGGNPDIYSILELNFKKVSALVVLLTPDDEVRLRSELWSKREKALEKTPRYQARPNVLFEAGWALGRYPQKSILVTVGNVKEFSDIAGKHMMYLDDSQKSRKHFANRLKSMGCEIDLEGDDWETAGSFCIKKPASKEGIK